MKAKSKVRLLFVFSLLALNIGCDQVSKNVARKSLQYYERTEVWGEYFVLTKIENKGAMLGAFSELPDSMRFVALGIVPALILLIGLVFLLYQKRIHMVRMVGFCLVIGGGAGNIIDRLVHGSVTDFMILSTGQWQTGIFNMADVSVMLGTALVLASTFRLRRKNQTQSQFS